MTKAIHAQTLIQAFEAFAPRSLAFEGDNVGLLVGTLNKDVKKVMVTLDVLENVVDEAVEQEVDLIIAHHPVIFRPLKQMFTDQGQGKIVSKCVKHDIAVYAAHTNLDIAEGGVNDMLANALNLKEVDILKTTTSETLYKFVVYVPESHQDSVRQAIGKAGAGFIGQYSHCTFNTLGIGTFKPEEGSHPYIGTKNKLEQVNEIRIETIVPDSLLKRTVNSAIKAHPYEEVAYDIYPLENKGKPYGIGRIGKLADSMTLEEFTHFVKKTYQVEGLRYVGDPSTPINKVAILGGDGNKYLSAAKRAGADVLVTGDIYYHTAHDAILMGLNLVDPGHTIESIMKEHVADFLTKVIKENKKDTEIIVSTSNTHPFQFMV